MNKDLLKGLSEEQIEKIKACKDSAELLSLAKAEGIELSDEQLAAISGGGLICSTPTFTCPECGSHNIDAAHMNGSLHKYWDLDCKDCGKHWRE